MNLIEQLGGYEKAKSIRDINIIEFDGDASGVTIHYMGNSITQEDLEKALLEYRRQHNIFEVGDCVVKTNPKIKHAHVRVVISTSPSGGAVLDYQGFPYKFPCIRHATDAEIKAGCRL